MRHIEKSKYRRLIELIIKWILIGLAIYAIIVVVKNFTISTLFVIGGLYMGYKFIKFSLKMIFVITCLIIKVVVIAAIFGLLII